MDKHTPTKVESIRLTVDHWAKLRRLMQAQGRAWLERAIDREHRRKLEDTPKTAVASLESAEES